MSLKRPIYMDHHATTPVDPRVFEAMKPCLTAEFGNPASASHSYGWQAEKKVEEARIQAARLIGSDPEEIYFTSGTTESVNWALKGAAEILGRRGGSRTAPAFVTQATEHKAVLETCRYLERKGVLVTYLPVDSTGLVSVHDLECALTDSTVLISVMFANHEIGTLQPIEAIGKIAKARGILFHVDAAQAAGKVPIDVQKMGIDLLSFSAHKMYGPKGIGALYIRSKNPHVRIAPFMHGGGQERGFRSGTLNVSGIVGFGKAAEIARLEMAEEANRLRALRDELQRGLEDALDEVYVNGHPAGRLPHSLNMSFLSVESDSLLTALAPDLAVSSGSACSSARPEPSYVLKALGIPGERIHSAIRFGLGRFTTAEEVEFAKQCVIHAVQRLREMSPVYQDLRKKAS